MNEFEYLILDLNIVEVEYMLLIFTVVKSGKMCSMKLFKEQAEREKGIMWIFPLSIFPNLHMRTYAC